jgi:hypothetical protein
VESLSGEDPYQDEIADFEGAWAYAAAMIATQSLLVSGGAQGGLATGFLEEQQVGPSRAVLTSLVEGEDSRRAVLELRRKDYFNSVDEEEGSLTGRLGCRCVDRPQHRL